MVIIPSYTIYLCYSSVLFWLNTFIIANHLIFDCVELNYLFAVFTVDILASFMQ